MRERWRNVILDGVKYEYRVSSKGRVRSKYTGKIRKVFKRGQRKGTYLYVDLFADGVRKRIDIQRLVAIIFIPNPHNKPEVNHVNCDPFDNRVDNLEWTTRSENEQHKHFWMSHREYTDWDREQEEKTEEDERREYEERIGAVSYG
jgi:hypothetical protein